MNFRPLIIALAALAVCSCGSPGGEDLRDCKEGRPEPIFREGNPEIVRHRFQLNRQESVETVVFSSGRELTLTQTGCDSVRQNFQFTLPGEFPDTIPAFWVDRAVEEFQYLASLDPQYMVFSSWAQAISAAAGDIRLAQSTEIQPGYFVRIDRIRGADDATLLVTLSESP